MIEAIDDFLRHGWALCKIKNGPGPNTKGAFEPGWGTPDGAYKGEGAMAGWTQGCGLLHAFSGTCAIDIDDLPLARDALLPHGVDLMAMLGAADAVAFSSGRPGRVKLLYTLETPMASVLRGSHGFEFRSGFSTGSSAQDVLPPTIHENGSPYRWLKGDWRKLPPLPAAVRKLWPYVGKLFPENVAPRAAAAPASSLTGAAMVSGLGDTGKVYEGNRDDAVSKKLFGMLRQGVKHEDALDLLLLWNQERLDDPLDDAHVRKIWRAKGHIEPEHLVVPETREVVAFPELPEGWRWQGTWLQAQDGAVDAATGEAAWVTLSSHPVFVDKVIRTVAADGTEVRTLDMVEYTKQGTKRYRVDAKGLLKEFESTLFNAGLHSAPTRMRNYLMRSKQMHENAGNVVDTFSTFGWQANDGFLVGDRLYMPGANAPTVVALSPALQNMGEMKPYGTLAGWRESAQELFAPNNISQSFSFLMGMGGPLMKLSGERGGMYSLVGVSGQGKSTVQEAISTAWGNPTTFHSRAEDTPNARMIMLALLSNLPMQAEEFTKLDAESLSQLVYSISEGRDKHRATTEGKLRESVGQWNTIVVASSNRSLLDVLMQNDSDAEAYRVLEDNIELPKGAKFADGQRIIRGLVANQGQAGHVFAQYIVDNREALVRSIGKVRDHITAKVTGGTKERIRVNMLACGIAAGLVLQNAGILHIDIPQFLDYGVNVLRACMGVQASAKSSSEDILADYINKNMAGALRMNGKNVASIGTRVPSAALCIRYDLGLGELVLDRKPLRAYVQERKSNWNEFSRDLSKLGIVKHDKKRVMLSADSGLPPAPQVWVLVLDANVLEGVTLAEETQPQLKAA